MVVKQRRARPAPPAPVTDGTPDPRARLIVAAVSVIERDGIAHATVRRIASEAGANIAAVNYYFGSKDHLLDVVLAHTLEEAFTKALTELDEAIAGEGDVQRGMRRYLEGYLVHAFRWPTISVGHLRQALLEQVYESAAVDTVRGFVRGLTERLSPAMPGPRDSHRSRVELVWMSITGHAMLPRLFAESGPADTRDFTNACMVSLFASPPPSDQP